MPMTTTHMMVPLLCAVAIAEPPVKWKLLLISCIAAAIPDIDGVFHHFLGVSQDSIYSHRGATHSLLVALAAGLIAAIFHKRVGVRPMTAGLAISAAMASHCVLDMMTASGRPVACLWPLSSQRLLADWRPIVGFPTGPSDLYGISMARAHYELWRLIIPGFGVAVMVRAGRLLARNRASWY